MHIDGKIAFNSPEQHLEEEQGVLDHSARVVGLEDFLQLAHKVGRGIDGGKEVLAFLCGEEVH